MHLKLPKIPIAFTNKEIIREKPCWEGRPSEKAVLISRLIDRPIRPLFPKGYRNDIQIVAQLFSYDQIHQPDTLAMLGASTALMGSDKHIRESQQLLVLLLLLISFLC